MHLLPFSAQFGLVCWKFGNNHARYDGPYVEDFVPHWVLINDSKKEKVLPWAW